MATEPDLDPLRTAAEQAYQRQPGEPSAGYISDTDALTATGSTFDGIDLAVTYTTDTAAEIAVDITELQTADQNLSDSLAAAVTTLEAADAATDAALAAAVTTLEAADAATDAALAAVDNRTLDTGWWQITTGDPALGEHVQAAVIRYRRHGPIVHVLAYDVILSETWINAGALVSFGPGIAPNAPGTAYLPNGCWGVTGKRQAYVQGNNELRLFDHAAGTTGLRYMWTWITADPFPDAADMAGTPQPMTKPTANE